MLWTRWLTLLVLKGLATIALDVSVGVGLSAESNPNLTIEPELDIAIGADVAAMPLGQVKEALLENQIETVAQLLPQLIADQIQYWRNREEIPFRLTDILFAAATPDWLDLLAGFE